MRRFALTDHDNVCGAMEFAQAVPGSGVRPIAGAELTVTDGAVRTLPSISPSWSRARPAGATSAGC